MILWINGPYGVGKSTLAEELHRRNPHSFIFDAEEVGNAVRENVPKELFNGYIYEGYPMWFRLCAELLTDLSGRYSGDIYVPMTLVRKDSFDKIRVPLEAAGIALCHILLESSQEIVHDRILARGEGGECWCMKHIGLCLESQREFAGVHRIASVGKTPPELAAEVLALQKEGRFF